jgi:hypothetical protein
MAEQKERKTAPIAVLSLVLAVLALVLAVITFSRVYDLSDRIGHLQKRLQEKEKAAQKKSPPSSFDVKEIGRKLAEAKDNIVNKQNRARAIRRLNEAREMMNKYKERVTPALQKRWADIMAETEAAGARVKGAARDVGAELDRLAQSVERFFADEKKTLETEAAKKPEATPQQPK